MSHNEIKKWIRLSLYSELTNEEQSALEAHLKDCDECRNELEQQRNLLSLISDKKNEVDDKLLMEARAQLRGAIRNERQHKGFLDNIFQGKYVVENVIPYYEPLIKAKKRGRHLYWTNFNLPSDIGERKIYKNMIERGDIKELSNFHDYNFKKYKGQQKINKIARNLVDYEVGKTIFETVLGVMTKKDVKQISLL